MSCFKLFSRTSVYSLATALLLYGVLGAVGVHAVVYKVGDDGNSCDFSDLQAALDVAAEHFPETVTIRVNRRIEAVTPPLVVRGANIVLDGGYFRCDSEGRAGTTDLSARGVNRVFVVAESLTDPAQSSRLTLRNVQVLDGRAFNGAGIQISGGSEVLLEDSNVIDNVATLRGGGIEVLEGSTLSISGDSRITANEAGRLGHSGEGAGIYCLGDDDSGGTVLLNDGPEISGNQAIRDGDRPARGGGFFLAGGCLLEMSGGVGVLLNRADEGGGGYLERSRIQLELNSDLKTMPRFDGNQVTASGGALALEDRSFLSMTRAAFINNGAALGASDVIGGALYLTGRSRVLRRSDSGVLRSPDCPRGPLCARFVGNRAATGALAFLESGSMMAVSGALIAENTASQGSLVQVVGNGGEVVLFNSLLVFNTLSNLLSGPTVDGTFQLVHNTIADNPGLQSVLHFDARNSSLIVRGNLVMERDVPVSTGPGEFDEEVWECHVGASGQNAPFDREIIIDNPDFADPENLDYHLGHDSQAIDVCDTDDFNFDLDGQWRPVDHPLRDGDRHADAGADEVQVLDDLVFIDRFEQQDL